MKILFLFILCSVSVVAEDGDDVLKKFQAHGLFTAGMYAYGEGDKARSEALFTVAIEDDPTLGRAHFHLGDIYFEKREFQRAIGAYETSIRIDSKYVFAYYNLACAKAQLSEVDGAFEALRRAVELGYNRIDTLKRDQDLALLRQVETFASIIKLIGTGGSPASEAEFVLGDESQKLTILSLKADADEWEKYAILALQDSSYRVRCAGYLVWAHAEKNLERKIAQLTQGLFDNNGYVNKAAANALVAIGNPSVPLMEQIEKSDYTGAKFYSSQILRVIRARQNEVK